MSQRSAVTSPGTIGEVGERLEPEAAEAYRRWLELLNQTGVPYLVGGAFAMLAHAGIFRDTKDLDVFIRPRDLKAVLEAMQQAGFDTEVRDVFWLAKVNHHPLFMDVIFGLSADAVRVEEEWFGNALGEALLGVPTSLLGLEELIATKAYVLRSDRFDGADICHLIRAARGKVDWPRVSALVHDPTILLWHLLLFGMIYPGHADYLPQEWMIEAFEQVRKGWSSPMPAQAFTGNLIDPLRFAVDVEHWGYQPLAQPTQKVTAGGEAL